MWEEEGLVLALKPLSGSCHPFKGAHESQALPLNTAASEVLFKARTPGDTYILASAEGREMWPVVQKWILQDLHAVVLVLFHSSLLYRK